MVRTKSLEKVFSNFKEVFFADDTYKELVSMMKFQAEQISEESQIFKDMIFAVTGNVHIFASRKEIQKKIVYIIVQIVDMPVII